MQFFTSGWESRTVGFLQSQHPCCCMDWWVEVLCKQHLPSLWRLNASPPPYTLVPIGKETKPIPQACAGLEHLTIPKAKIQFWIVIFRMGEMELKWIIPFYPIFQCMTYFSFLNLSETHDLHGLHPILSCTHWLSKHFWFSKLESEKLFSQKWIITIIHSVILDSYKIKSWIISNSNLSSKHYAKKSKWAIIMFSSCVKCHETWLCVICGIF